MFKNTTTTYLQTPPAMIIVLRRGVSLLNNSNEAVCSAAVVWAAVQFRSLRPCGYFYLGQYVDLGGLVMQANVFFWWTNRYITSYVFQDPVSLIKHDLVVHVTGGFCCHCSIAHENGMSLKTETFPFTTPVIFQINQGAWEGIMVWSTKIDTLREWPFFENSGNMIKHFHVQAVRLGSNFEKIADKSPQIRDFTSKMTKWMWLYIIVGQESSEIFSCEIFLIQVSIKFYGFLFNFW